MFRSLDHSKWIGMPTKSDICWIFENNIMALLKWLQNHNEPLKNQLGMCCEFVVQSLKKLACSRCCTCTRLHRLYELLQQKSQRYPTLQQRLASNLSALDFPPGPFDTPTLRSKKPSSWSDFSLLASAKRIAAWHHDTTVIFENLPHFLGRRGGWIAKKMIWKSDCFIFTLGYNSGLPVFVGDHILRSKQVGGKLYELESSILPDQIYPLAKS